MSKFCQNCGNQLNEEADFCVKCGKVIEKKETNAPGQTVIVNNIGKPCNKWVAFLLCFFLGGLGVHKFYEGKVGMGILYFFTIGLFGIGWFIDLICILCKPRIYYTY